MSILKFIFEMCMLAEAVYLASEDKNGWGWLIFIMLVTI